MIIIIMIIIIIIIGFRFYGFSRIPLGSRVPVF